jgi:CO dehydrogenase maturation factor
MSTLRIAVAGKGGAGKTTLSATMARLLARRGQRVLVVDADSNPNVGVALGLNREQAAALAPLPTGLVSRRLDGPRLVEPVSSVVARCGAVGPDGTTVVHMAMPAHADEGCLCSSHATVSALLADAADAADSVVIVDLEASPEHFGRGTTRHVDVLLFVVEPYYRSLETTRRMARLAAELPIARTGVVANKLRSPADAEAVAEFCDRHGLRLEGRIPWSAEVLDADLAGTPVIDHGPAQAAVTAIGHLCDSLLGATRPVAPVA